MTIRPLGCIQMVVGGCDYAFILNRSWKPLIFMVWVAPRARETIPKGGGPRRPHISENFMWALGPPKPQKSTLPGPAKDECRVVASNNHLGAQRADEFIENQ